MVELRLAPPALKKNNVIVAMMKEVKLKDIEKVLPGVKYEVKVVNSMRELPF